MSFISSLIASVMHHAGTVSFPVAGTCIILFERKRVGLSIIIVQNNKKQEYIFIFSDQRCMDFFIMTKTLLSALIQTPYPEHTHT